MKRSFESVDLIVGIGVIATIAAMFLFFVLPGKMLIPTDTAAGVQARDGRSWIQPVVGQAIVDAELTSRQTTHDLALAARRLLHAVSSAESLHAADSRIAEQLQAEWQRIGRDHEVRIQFILGASIVNATARGVRVGVLDVDRMNGQFNRRLIATAQSMATDAHEAFTRDLQAAIGQAIVTATTAHVAARERSQEQIGGALVRVIRAQDTAEARSEMVQEQLASVVMAAARTEEAAATTSAGTAAIGGAWPDVPIAVFAAVSVMLLGIFVVGVLLPPGPAREAPPSVQITEEAPPYYRKTA